MREKSIPPLVDVPVVGSLVSDVFRRSADNPHAVMLRRRDAHGWRDVSSSEFAAEVNSLAKGLIAAGVNAGDRVAIMSATRYEWTLFDYAIWCAGAVSVPIYETSSAAQVEWICSDSEAVAIVVENEANAEVVAQASAGIAQPLQVWQIDDGAVGKLGELGQEVDQEQVDTRWQQCESDTVATIVYTSGTTGMPKGCTLTHANFMADVRNVVHSMPQLFFDPKASTLLFLPIAHVFGRLIQVGCIFSGTVLGHSGNIKNILNDLAEFQPTFLLAVPRVFEKVYNSAEQKAIAGGKGKIFSMAAQTAIDYSTALDNGGPSLLLKLKHKLFDTLVYSKLRSALGGQVSYAVSGGAPLGARLGHFFRGVGVTILEGYGLTETTGASTVSRPDLIRIGTVGNPIPGVTVRIADDGEILIKGKNIFRGYWNNPKATDEAIDQQGWFHSGDIGEIDADGFVKITGRKKELIVTAGGKNVAPAVLEDKLRSHVLVSQCLVVGDQRPYIAALITLDAEAIVPWAQINQVPSGLSLAEYAQNEVVKAEIAQAVAAANSLVSNAEVIKRYEILPEDWTQEAGQLTPSLKLKRKVVMTDYEEYVARLYQ